MQAHAVAFSLPVRVKVLLSAVKQVKRCRTLYIASAAVDVLPYARLHCEKKEYTICT